MFKLVPFSIENPFDNFAKWKRIGCHAPGIGADQPESPGTSIALSERFPDFRCLVITAQASLSQALLDLRHTRVVAPGKGILGEVNLRQGSFCGCGSESVCFGRNR
jgi:hypothetical protein